MVKCIGLMAIIAICTISCEKNAISPDPVKKIFVLRTGPIDSTNKISVSFGSSDTLFMLPEIRVNNKQPDTIENNIGFYRATFRDIFADSSIHFYFSYDGSTIQKQIMIPDEIDSIFCNGQYVPLDGWDTVFEIDSAPSYLFSWKTSNRNTYFTLEYYGAITNDEKEFGLTNDTFYIFSPKPKSDNHTDFHLLVENNYNNAATGIPDASSENVSLYYGIWKTRYPCHFYMSK